MSDHPPDAPDKKLPQDKPAGSTQQKDRDRYNEDIFKKFAAGKLFRSVSILQTSIHLCTYIASFIKLIAIEGGGYYNVSILLFVSITILSMPLFLSSYWLIEHSLNISKKMRAFGYFFHAFVLLWSIFIVRKSYT